MSRSTISLEGFDPNRELESASQDDTHIHMLGWAAVLKDVALYVADRPSRHSSLLHSAEEDGHSTSVVSIAGTDAVRVHSFAENEGEPRQDAGQATVNGEKIIVNGKIFRVGDTVNGTADDRLSAIKTLQKLVGEILNSLTDSEFEHLLDSVNEDSEKKDSKLTPAA